MSNCFSFACAEPFFNLLTANKRAQEEDEEQGGEKRRKAGIHVWVFIVAVFPGKRCDKEWEFSCGSQACSFFFSLPILLDSQGGVVRSKGSSQVSWRPVEADIMTGHFIKAFGGCLDTCPGSGRTVIAALHCQAVQQHFTWYWVCSGIPNEFSYIVLFRILHWHFWHTFLFVCFLNSVVNDLLLYRYR